MMLVCTLDDKQKEWWPGHIRCQYSTITKSVVILVKDIYYCPIEIIKELTDKGQFQ